MEALDSIFELFTRERRRYVLYYLDQQGGRVSVSDLESKLEEWERSESEPPIPDGSYEQVRLSLEHQHLPKAAEAEFVEYDRENGTIEIAGAPAEFRVILRVSEAIERPGEQDILHLQ